MFVSALSQPGGFGRAVKTRLDDLKDVLVLSAADSSIRSRCALILQMAPGARGRPVLVKRLAVLDGGESMDGCLPRGTPVDVTPTVVDEVTFVEAPFKLAA